MLRSIVDGFENLVGRAALVSLSADYAQGARFDELLEQVYSRLQELLQGLSMSEALARFSEDGAVRIMTVHKSKGLEFHTVIALGIENQIFFSTSDKTRPIFFVQIARAKDRLVLTRAAHRPRPEGYTGIWEEHRTPKSEFIEYGRTAYNS
jgi:superfamily I DNA/RNA helicase